MNFLRYRVLILVITVMLALFVASPAIARFTVLPPVATYSELGLLGHQRVADNYPDEVHSGQANNVFVEVTNRLGHLAYYAIDIKLVNNLADIAQAPTLNHITFFVASNESYELPLTFSINYASPTDSAQTQIAINNIIVNGVTCTTEGYFAAKHLATQQFRTYLVFELWIYSDQLGGFENHDRYVDLVLNLR